MYQQLDVEAHQHPRPSLWLLGLELPRLMAEAGSLLASWPILNDVPRGDGHAVLVLPGFITGDSSTLVLRRYLNHLGYNALPWKLGQNTGQPSLQVRLADRFADLVEQHEAPITLIGQSLGGVYARELAHQFSGSIRNVITLGSPFKTTGTGTTHPLVARLFERMSGASVSEMRERMLDRNSTTPLPVPTTAIYSRTDAIVSWQTCIEPEHATSESIEIVGSHSGMALNPMVLHIIADRMAQKSATWQKFDRHRGRLSRLLPYRNAQAQKVSEPAAL